MLGCDVILYAVRKDRGWVMKLEREEVLPWCECRYREREKASLFWCTQGNTDMNELSSVKNTYCVF